MCELAFTRCSRWFTCSDKNYGLLISSPARRKTSYRWAAKRCWLSRIFYFHSRESKRSSMKFRRATIFPTHVTLLFTQVILHTLRLSLNGPHASLTFPLNDFASLSSRVHKCKTNVLLVYQLHPLSSCAWHSSLLCCITHQRFDYLQLEARRDDAASFIFVNGSLECRGYLHSSLNLEQPPEPRRKRIQVFAHSGLMHLWQISGDLLVGASGDAWEGGAQKAVASVRENLCKCTSGRWTSIADRNVVRLRRGRHPHRLQPTNPALWCFFLKFLSIYRF